MNKVEVLRKMLAADADNASVWYLLGMEYAEQGSPTNALQSYTRALQTCDDELKPKILSELTKLSEGTFLPTASAPSGISTSTPTPMDEEKVKIGVDKGRVDEEAVFQPMRVIHGGKSHPQGEPKDTQAVVTFRDVGGLQDVKESIRMKIIKPFTSPGLFEKFKKKVGGGILLYGPPGCGKSFVAKATAGECNAKFVSVHITDVLDPYLGVSEQNLRDVFSSARAQKPCILFFDEIDAIGYNRSKSSSSTMRTVIDQLLTEIEGIDTSTDKILVIGATNMPWDVDSAFKRPGRFDKMIFVGPPDVEARAVVFQLKLAERPVENIDYAALAAMTELYSGADIDNVVEVATEHVISEIMSTGVERPIRMADLQEVITETKPSTVDWLRTVKNYVKYANQSGLYDEVERFLSSHKKI